MDAPKSEPKRPAMKSPPGKLKLRGSYTPPPEPGPNDKKEQDHEKT
jgi:hypothetical protein